jgi:predicted lipoprotein
MRTTIILGRERELRLGRSKGDSRMSSRSLFHLPRALHPWVVPFALASVGAWGWACQDTGSADGSGVTGDDDDADDDASGDDDADGPGDDDADDDAPGDDDADGSGGGGGGGNVTPTKVLASIGARVITPATAELEVRATALRTAVDAFAAAAASGEAVDESLAGAQAQWREVMAQQQQLEVMQVGPAGSSLVAIGGEDLRDAIYSWPTSDTCSVDRALVDQDYLAKDFFVTELVWAYGLDALEYLLFGMGDMHTCPAQVQLDGPWAALDPAERMRRRAAYAAVLAGGVADRSAELAARWSTEGDDFGALLAAPGEGDSPYSDTMQALDEVFRAMFYVDKLTKDAKLGVPLGIVEGCAVPPCIDLMELPHSGDAARAMRSNLEALALMVKGGPDAATASGFDDLLVNMGEGQIAEDLLAAIDVAIAATEAYELSLQSELATDPAALDDLYGSIRGVTDILKGPFVMALMLTIPADGAGDND